MPKVLAHTPDWLCRGNPGFDFFQSKTISTAKQHTGANKTIAYRGTEIFLVVGRELRWADLNILQGKSQTEGTRGYRVLKVPGHGDVTQISISADGGLIAILTTHTCHVCVLPASSHLNVGKAKDQTELKMKSFTLGPTAHVVEQAPLATALWHPLSRPDIPCLVTVTKDACVRLWELDISNRNSFNEPAIAVDLKKLANATSTAADLSASGYGTRVGFSPDQIEMEVAAATFGGLGQEDEDGWASLTLWLAMTEGDVYALCPFLPSSFRVPGTMLPALSTSVVAKSRAITQAPDIEEQTKRAVDAQTKWLADLDEQDPTLLPGQTDFDSIEIYRRPERPGAMPKLQGPFHINPEPDFGEVTDIHVIAPVIDQTDLYDDEFDDDMPQAEGLSISVVCLATSTNKINICLDLDGLEGAWLPPRRSNDPPEASELLLFATVDLDPDSDNTGHSVACPTFTYSPVERYQLFVTTTSGVYTLDLQSWTSALEAELANPTSEGGNFRANLFLDSAETLVDHPVDLSHTASRSQIPKTAIALLDASLGHFLLTSTPSGPYAATLDLPAAPSNPYEPEMLALPAPEPRDPYQPPAAFYAPSQLPNLLKLRSNNDLARANFREPMRFTPDNLQFLTEAHRILSHETNNLGLAAADLFRRCERLRNELHDQVAKVRDLADRVDRVTGDDDRDEVAALGASVQGEIIEQDKLFGNDGIEQRMLAVGSNAKNLNDRVEGLRQKMARLGGRELSKREAAFGNEVARLKETLAVDVMDSVVAPTEPDALLHMPNSPPSSPEQEQGHGAERGSLKYRFDQVEDLQDQLVQQATKTVERLAEREGREGREGSANGGSGVGKEFRKQRLQQVLSLLERETALVDGVTERLRRLGGLP